MKNETKNVNDADIPQNNAADGVTIGAAGSLLDVAGIATAIVPK